MKILTYQSNDFWRQLEEHLFIRDEETSSKIEADVKSIIKEIREYGDDKVIQFAQDFDKITIKKDEIKLPNLKNFYSLENLNNEIQNLSSSTDNIEIALETSISEAKKAFFASDIDVSNAISMLSVEDDKFCISLFKFSKE